MEAICVGQQWDDDVRVVLFVVLRQGGTLDDALRDRIEAEVRANTTPRHVPAKIIQIAEIPRTISGKIVELAVRNVIHGCEVHNKDALANPGYRRRVTCSPLGQAQTAVFEVASFFQLPILHGDAT